MGRRLVTIWATYGDVRVTRAPLGVSGGENCVDEDESADDLGAESSAGVVARSDGVGPTAERIVVAFHEGLHQPNPRNRPQTLRYHVRHRSDQRHLPRQE